MGKILCDECKLNRRTNGVRKFKGRFICYKCFHKIANIIYLPRTQSLEEALNKERIVHMSGTIKSPTGQLGLPRVLIGRKVKLVLIE